MEVVQHLYMKIMREIWKHVTERLAGWRPVVLQEQFAAETIIQSA
jgi:hypothetical protein